MVIDDKVMDLLQWIVGVLIIPAAIWFWRNHEREHESIQKNQKALWAKADKLEVGMLTASSGLNDRIMEHIDVQVRETRSFVISEDEKIISEVTRQRDVAAKIFDQITETRKEFTTVLAENNRRSEDRHAEQMKAIHQLAMSMHEGLSRKVDK